MRPLLLPAPPVCLGLRPSLRLRLIVVPLLVAPLLVLSACSSAASTPWQTEDQIQAVDGQTWVVGGHLVTVAAGTTPSGKPTVGATVRLSGQRTARGELLADSVEVLSPTPTSPASRVAPTPPPTPVRATPPAQTRATPQRPPPKHNGNHQGDADD